MTAKPAFRALEGCVFAASFGDVAPGFGPLASSLLYQAKALGLRLAPAAVSNAREEHIAFAVAAPNGAGAFCEVSGWPGHKGAASETLTQAACGLMSVHGRASGRAQPLGVNYVSTLAAVLALQGALAAALGRMRGAHVARVRLSLAEAGLLAVGQYLAGASACQQAENIAPGATSPTERPPFVSRDGVVFELETLDAGPWRAFWAEAGVDAQSAAQGWSGFLLRYAKGTAPLPPALRAAAAALPYAEIAARCARAGLAICPVRRLQDRAGDADALRMWREGPWAFRFGAAGAAASPGAAPGDLPLAGLTVIESCRRIQGPLAGHLLALLGAKVLRIEPPGGDPLRGMPPVVEGVSARYDALNRLKTVREIDLKSRQGQAEIQALAREADVFLHNWAPGKAAQLNLDFDDLRCANPALVYAYASGFGPAAEIAAPGTDFMVQAYSGVAEKIARASGLPGGTLFTALDILGGAVAAQAITAALLARHLRGPGARVDTSLLGAAALLCAEDLGAALRQEDAGQRRPRGERISGVYPAREGRIAIDCAAGDEMRSLARTIGLGPDADASRIEARLPMALMSRSAAEWAALLNERGAPAAVVVEDLCALREDARLRACFERASYTKINSPWRFQ